jgi:hypothetical protein
VTSAIAGAASAVDRAIKLVAKRIVIRSLLKVKAAPG